MKSPDEYILGFYVKPFVLLEEDGWNPGITRLDSLQGKTHETFLLPFEFKSDAENIAKIIAAEENETINRTIQSFFDMRKVQ